MNEFEFSDYLGFTVIASIIATFGSLVALFLKDFFFIRINEKWKERRALQQIYKKYKNPLVLSSKEIALRFDEIGRRKRTAYYKPEVFKIKSEYFDPQNHHGPYFSEYKLLSAIYRLCAFLGWIELLRIEVTFLESGKNNLDSEIRNQIRAIQSKLSDLQLNPDKEKIDVVIFREEQRAIGEGMIKSSGSEHSIIGYGTFLNLYKEFIQSEDHDWLKPVVGFFKEIQAENDFRMRRAVMLRDEIIKFIYILDEKEGQKMENIVNSAI